MAPRKTKEEKEKVEKPAVAKRPRVSRKKAAEQPAAEVPPSTPVAVAEVPQPEQASTEVLCATCGVNPAAPGHRYCSECYQVWREAEAERRANRPMVDCANCGEQCTQYIVDGEPRPSYCFKCRQAHKARSGQAVSSPAVAASQPAAEVRKGPRDQAVELNAVITALLPQIEADLPNRDFGKIKRMHQEGKDHLMAGRIAEATSSFEAVFINLSYLETAHQIATVEIPEALEELKELTGPHMDRPEMAAFLENLHDQAAKWADPEQIENCLAQEPVDARKYIGTRLERIESIIGQIEDRLDEAKQIEAGIASTPVDQLLPALKQRYKLDKRGGGKEVRQAARRERRQRDRGNLLRFQDTLAHD